MRQDVRAGDEQAQTGSRDLLEPLRPEMRELVEDTRTVLGCDPGAAIEQARRMVDDRPSRSPATESRQSIWASIWMIWKRP